MRTSWRSKGLSLFIIFLIGFVLSASLGIMQISGKFNLDKFYDVGKIYEMPFTSHDISGLNCDYEAETNIHKITADHAEYKLTLRSPDFSWKYITLKLNEFNMQNSNQMPWKLFFYNKKGELVGENSFYPKQGMQVVQITPGAFSCINIVMEHQQNVNFSVKKIMLYENEPVFNSVVFAKWFMLYFISWLAFVLICRKTVWNKLKGIKWYHAVDGLQSIFLYISNRFYEKNCAILKIYHEQIRQIRTGLFLGMFAFMTVIDDTANYKGQGYNYLLLGCTIIITIIAIMSIEKPGIKLNWNHPFVVIWYVFWIMTCISDFIIPKDFHYTGYIMLLAVGLLFFVWNNMSSPIELLQEMRRALEISFLPAILFCLFFRPLDLNMRYSGINDNPIPFAIYLVVVLLAYYARVLETMILKDWNWKNIIYVIAIILDISMAWRTQSAFGLLAIGIVTSFFLLWVHIFWKHKNKKVILMYLIAFALCTIPISSAGKWGLTHISERFGKQIVFNDDTPDLMLSYQNPLSTTVYASDSRIVTKFLKSPNLELLTTERTLYYKAYLREMNLFGHAKSATFLDGRHQAHNAIIMTAYRYGVFAAIPYLLLIILFIYLSWKNLKKKYQSADAWFLVAVSTVIPFMMMCDNLEQPFRWVSWPVYFLAMGYLFHDSKYDKIDNKKN